MIDLVAEISIIKMVVVENFVLKEIESDNNNINIRIDLIKENITVLLQIIILRFKIRFFETIVIYLIYCLIIFEFQDEYLLILFYNYLKYL